ncbi:MAG: hypothetical protein AAGI01_15400, partial [Myxococcota bacterium]
MPAPSVMLEQYSNASHAKSFAQDALVPSRLWHVFAGASFSELGLSRHSVPASQSRVLAHGASPLFP